MDAGSEPADDREEAAVHNYMDWGPAASCLAKTSSNPDLEMTVRLESSD